jgi:hypothetical protein
MAEINRQLLGEAMRWNTAVEKRPHFAFHEKRHRVFALLMAIYGVIGER